MKTIYKTILFFSIMIASTKTIQAQQLSDSAKLAIQNIEDAEKQKRKDDKKVEIKV